MAHIVRWLKSIFYCILSPSLDDEIQIYKKLDIELQSAKEQSRLDMAALSYEKMINRLLKLVEENIEGESISIVFKGTVRANATETIDRAISQEFSFDLIYITGIAYKCNEYHLATSVPQTNLQIRICDRGRDRYLTFGGDWIHWENIINDKITLIDKLLYIISGRRRFSVGTSIGLKIRDLSGYETSFEIVMHGFIVSPYHISNKKGEGK